MVTADRSTSSAWIASRGNTAVDLQHYIDHPDEELGFDDVEAIGLDGTGRAADRRFPYTWAGLTDAERSRLCAHANGHNDAHAGTDVADHAR